jgi:hypothetical protein
MRAAVLSDIHGHLPAMDAVLADVDRAGVDRIVLTGDIAAGPMPVPTLRRLLALGDRVVWVRATPTGSAAYHDVVQPATRLAVVRANYVNGVDASNGYAYILRTLSTTTR